MGERWTPDDAAALWALSIAFFAVLLLSTAHTAASPVFLAGLSPPQNPSARPGNAAAYLYWGVPEMGASTVTGYKVYRSTDMELFSEVSLVGADQLSYEDRGLINSQTYYYRLTAVNPLGESDPSEIVSVVPDGEPPIVAVQNPKEGAVVGIDRIETSWDAVESESGIERFETSLDGSTWMDQGLSRSVWLYDLDDGEHSFSVRCTDWAGNTGEDTVSFMVDTIAPYLDITGPMEGSFHSTNSVTIEWTSSDEGSGSRGIGLELDSEAPVFLEDASSYELTYLSTGHHMVTLTCWDWAGLKMTDSINFTVDLDDPQVSFSGSATGNFINRTFARVYWTGGDRTTDVSYKLRIDGSDWIQKGKATNHNLTGLAEGGHLLEVEATDRSGRNTSDRTDLVVDLTPPVVRLEAHGSPWYVGSDDLDLTWEPSDKGSGISKAFVSLDGVEWMEARSSNRHIFRGLTDGNYTIDIRVLDKAGNQRTVHISAVIDTTQPFLLFASPAGEEVISFESVQVIFSEKMDLDSLTVLMNGLDGEIVQNGDRISFHPSKRPEFGRTYRVTINGTDLAGNPINGYIFEFTMTDLAVIRGKVVDGNGLPIREASIILDTGRSTVTDSEGSFILEETMGPRVIYVVKKGYRREELSINATPEHENVVPTFVLARQGLIERSIPSFLMDPWTYLFLLLVVMLMVAVALYLFNPVEKISRMKNRPEIDWEDDT